MKLASFFCLCFIVTNINAQNIILFEEDSISQSYVNVDITSNAESFTLDLFFKNNTSDTIAVNWRREFGDNCPIEWGVISGDEIMSYPPAIDESAQAIPLLPSDSNFIIRQIFLPETVPGCCDVKMIFSLEGSPNVSIDTAYYQIEINSEGCLATPVIENMRDKFIIFPNPTSSIINIETELVVESIEIFDLNGKNVNRHIYSNSSQFDISSFSPGIYIMKIKSDTGDFIMKKIIKQ